MGRTVPTFRQLIDDAIARWSKFRRALRREDQEYFDRLFRRVRSYTQAATYQASDNPMEAILLSIALDQEKRLGVLERVVQPQGVLHLPETGVGSTWSPPEETGVGSTWSPPEESPMEQLDVPQSPGENEQPDIHPRPDRGQQIDPGQQLNPRQQLNADQQRNATQWLDFRSLPEPARDEAVADRAKPEAPPVD
jgi:hypothetical protein